MLAFAMMSAIRRRACQDGPKNHDAPKTDALDRPRPRWQSGALSQPDRCLGLGTLCQKLETRRFLDTAVIDTLIGQIKGDDLTIAGVNADVKLSPGAALHRPVLFKQPFFRATQLQVCAVDDQVKFIRCR